MLSLEAEWDALLDQSAQQVFFLRWHWIRSWWEHLAPPSSRLHILCSRDDAGRLVGLAPLYQRTLRVFGLPVAHELAMLGTGIDLKTSEYLDVIAMRGHEDAVADSMAACLRDHTQWDRLWMLRVPRESPIVGRLMSMVGGTVRSEVCDSAPYIDTMGTWDAYKRLLGRSMRRNVEYYARRLGRDRTSRFALVVDAAEVGPAFDELMRLHQARWEAAGEPGSFKSKAARAFFREVVQRSFAAGHLRLWTLTIDGRVEAALVGFLDNGVLHYFQKGFNPAYSKDAIGTAMLSLCLRASFDDPAIAAFDFMGGGAEYKTLWTRAQRESMLHEIQRESLGGRCHAAIVRADEALRRIYRAWVPAALRARRREWMRSRRVRSLIVQIGWLGMMSCGDWPAFCCCV